MNFGEWQVKIEHRFEANTNYIYLFQKTQRGLWFITHTGDAVMREYGSSELRDNLYFATADDDQLQALAEGFAAKGIKNANDHKAEGLLEATRVHLEDMRKIVFKKEGIK